MIKSCVFRTVSCCSSSAVFSRGCSTGMLLVGTFQGRGRPRYLIPGMLSLSVFSSACRIASEYFDVSTMGRGAPPFAWRARRAAHETVTVAHCGRPSRRMYSRQYVPEIPADPSLGIKSPCQSVGDSSVPSRLPSLRCSSWSNKRLSNIDEPHRAQ